MFIELFKRHKDLKIIDTDTGEERLYKHGEKPNVKDISHPISLMVPSDDIVSDDRVINSDAFLSISLKTKSFNNKLYNEVILNDNVKEEETWYIKAVDAERLTH